MKPWWRRRSLKFRLAVWFTAVASGILLGLSPVVFGLIELRLHAEFDRQLRIDWDLAVAHLETDAEGHVQWRAEGSSAADGLAQAGMWFEVWSQDQRLLLRHWPGMEAGAELSPPSPEETGEVFQTTRLKNGMSVRLIERPTPIRDQLVTLRVFRDESGLHRTLREILIGFALGVPVAALLAALGGYVMAGKMLAPLGAMAEQARRITSESLNQRLPVPNPHDELGQLATVFNQTLQRLDDSFDALKRFTADASHELRTPLTALRSVGEVALRDSGDASALRETVGSMLEEAQRLNDLIDSMLLLARFESGRLPLRPEAVDLADLLAGLREGMEILAAEKQQTLALAANAGVIASADRVLLRQAAMNILHNAIRHSAPGTKVRMRCFHRDGHAVIEIADEGPGIPAAHLPRIFERFYRIDKARSRADGGAGLGLSIASLSVRQLGGTIEVESTEGQGSTFRIILPVG